MNDVKRFILPIGIALPALLRRHRDWSLRRPEGNHIHHASRRPSPLPLIRSPLLAQMPAGCAKSRRERARRASGA